MATQGEVTRHGTGWQWICECGCSEFTMSQARAMGALKGHLNTQHPSHPDPYEHDVYVKPTITREWQWTCTRCEIAEILPTALQASEAAKTHTLAFNDDPMHIGTPPSDYDVQQAIESIEETIRGHTEPAG